MSYVDPVLEERRAALTAASTDHERMIALLWLAKRHLGIDDDACARVLAEAEPLVESIGGNWENALFGLLVAGRSLFRGVWADSFNAGYRSLRLARQAEDPWLLAFALVNVGLIQVWAGDATAAVELSEEALALIPDGSEDPAWLEVLGDYHNIMSFVEDANDNLAAASHHRELSNQAYTAIPHYPGLPVPDQRFVEDSIVRGDPDRIERVVDELEASASERGVGSRFAAAIDTLRGLIAYMRGENQDFPGRLEAAVVQFSPNHPETRNQDLDRERFQYSLFISVVLLRQTGQWERLTRIIDHGLRQAPELLGPRGKVRSLETKAFALEQLGQYPLALTALREAQRTEREIGIAQARQRLEQMRLSKEVEAQFKLTELERSKNTELDAERSRVEKLLLNVLPEPIVAELKTSNESPSRTFGHVAVLAADIVGFSTLAREMTPHDLFEELNEVFGAFDALVTSSGGQRLKTIGDAYLAVAGILDESENPSQALVSFAQSALQFLSDRKGQALNRMRFGIHVGPVTAGIVGKTRYVYDVFGDTVNTAFRLEGFCPPGHVCISAAVRRQLRDPESEWLDHGAVDLKGVGAVHTFVSAHTSTN